MRERIALLSERHGHSLATMSRVMGKYDRFLDRFVREGFPEQLPLEGRARLTRFLGIPPRDLDAQFAPSTIRFERERRRPFGTRARPVAREW